MGACAYCHVDAPLTREHLFPDWLLRALPDHTEGYIPKAGRILQADATIRDVCAKCNNGALSQLDAMAKSMLSRHLNIFPDTGDPPVEFAYEYQPLLKWLLKCSYNAARAATDDKAHVQAFADLASYAIGLDSHPPRHTALLVGIVTPTRMTDAERRKAPASIAARGAVPPAYIRLSRLDTSRLPQPLQARMFAIHALHLVVAVGESPSIQSASNFACGILNLQSHLKFLFHVPVTTTAIVVPIIEGADLLAVHGPSLANDPRKLSAHREWVKANS